MKLYRKYLEGTYRAKPARSWGIDLIRERLILRSQVRFLVRVIYNSSPYLKNVSNFLIMAHI
jgi:hypothetical protein